MVVVARFMNSMVVGGSMSNELTVKKANVREIWSKVLACKNKDPTLIPYKTFSGQSKVR